VAAGTESGAAFLTGNGVRFVDIMAPLTDYAGHELYSMAVNLNFNIKVKAEYFICQV
jgi:hypothetical protein